MPSRKRATPVALALALGLAGPTLADPADWRAARWGMTREEVLAAMPGDATALPEPVKLADGNAVVLEARPETIAGIPFEVALVFDGAGRLTLVSLRSARDRSVRPADYDAVRREVAERMGRAGILSSDANFIDMRQETWKTPRTRVDVKYIPGTVVVMYSAFQPESRPAPSRP